MASDRLGFRAGANVQAVFGFSPALWANARVMTQVWIRVQDGVRVHGGVGVQVEDRVYDSVGVFAWVGFMPSLRPTYQLGG